LLPKALQIDVQYEIVFLVVLPILFFGWKRN